MVDTNPEGVGMATDERTAAFWIAFRQGLLLIVDSIERYMGISPTTAEVRQLYKAARRGGDGT